MSELVPENPDYPQHDPDAIYTVAQNLYRELPDIAKSLITVHLDMSEPANVAFAVNPDDYLQHSPNWHQHGVVTHSREFARAMKETIPQYLQQWGLEEPANLVLNEEIDGVQKRELLELASLLHDVGKFTARTLDEYDHDSGEVHVHFDDHEEHSGNIIRSVLREPLSALGLTENQVLYIARCAELHFELGKVRRVAKANGGYTMAFVDTREFREAAQEIIDKNPDFALEVGMQFIADNLSKSEVRSNGITDGGIESQREQLVAAIAQRGLNPRLISQALQMPVNFKVARTYLAQWATTKNVYLPAALLGIG